MSAPDHRPYLVETDLRTAEDVLAWLDARAAFARDRDERERRQACRRGARSMARGASHARRMQRLRLRDCSAHGEVDARAWHEERVACIRRALAFRAAARTP